MSRTACALVTLIAASMLCTCGLCSDQVTSEVTSPDGILAATAFIRDCGATTQASSVVSVHRVSEGFRDSDDLVFVAQGQHPLSLRWDGPRSLTITCSTCSRKHVFRHVRVLGDVDVVLELGAHACVQPGVLATTRS